MEDEVIFKERVIMYEIDPEKQAKQSEIVDKIADISPTLSDLCKDLYTVSLNPKEQKYWINRGIHDITEFDRRHSRLTKSEITQLNALIEQFFHC